MEDDSKELANQITQTEQLSTEILKPTNTPVNLRKTKQKYLPWAATAFAILLIIGLAAWGIQQSANIKKSKSEASIISAENKQLAEEVKEIKQNFGEANVDKSCIQAVFLKGGKVYFGRITNITDTQIMLVNIYYFRENGQNRPDLDNLPHDISLVKSGCEVHKPKDEMFIERKEVEFWENIKKDVGVAQAIDAYKKAYPNGQKCEPEV